MDERHPAAVGGLGDHLVPEHSACVLGAQLLDVGAAEPAGEHADDVPLGLVDLREPRPARRVEDDCAHRRIVGRAR